MRISELIRDLEKIRNERGDLLVAIYRNESGDEYSFYNNGDGSYCKDINLEVVNNTNFNLKNDISETIIINDAYFLAIG